MKKNKFFWVLFIIVLILGGYFYFQSRKKEVAYMTVEVKKENLAKTVSATGSIQSRNKAEVSFKLSGKIKKIFFEVGDKVKEDEVVAVLDREELNYEVNQARADLEAQKKSLALMKRKRDNYTHEQLDIQREVVKKSEANLSISLKKIDETILRAPIAGTIIKKNVNNSGENVIANEAIFLIADDEELLIEANVPESDIVDLSVGQKATVSLDAFSSEEKLEAELIEIEPASTTIQDVIYYKIKLKLSVKDDRLKIGMSVDEDISVQEKKDVISVPLRSVAGEGADKYVEVLKEGNQAERIKVKTGLSGDEGKIEITEGLLGGEKIIISSKEE